MLASVFPCSKLTRTSTYLTQSDSPSPRGGHQRQRDLHATPSLCPRHLFSPRLSPCCPLKIPGTLLLGGFASAVPSAWNALPDHNHGPQSSCDSFLTLRTLPQRSLCGETLSNFPVLSCTRQTTCFPPCFAFPQSASHHGHPIHQLTVSCLLPPLEGNPLSTGTFISAPRTAPDM